MAFRFQLKAVDIRSASCPKYMPIYFARWSNQSGTGYGDKSNFTRAMHDCYSMADN
jgi:hypothetical protein